MDQLDGLLAKHQHAVGVLTERSMCAHYSNTEEAWMKAKKRVVRLEGDIRALERRGAKFPSNFVYLYPGG